MGTSRARAGEKKNIFDAARDDNKKFIANDELYRKLIEVSELNEVEKVFERGSIETVIAAARTTKGYPLLSTAVENAG